MNAPLVWRDPVVAEIHAVRAELAREYADDLVVYSRAAVARCRLKVVLPICLAPATNTHLRFRSAATKSSR